MKKIVVYIFILVLSLAFTACSGNDMQPLPGDDSTAAETSGASADIADIDLSSVGDSGGGYYSITSAGTYRLFSRCSVGVRVEVKKTERVHLILDGADILNENGAALYIASCDEAVITLADGSENYLSDGYDYADVRGSEPNACLFSKDDLTFDGGGTLYVHGRCNNGIGTKNDLEILSGSITVTAPKNAIKGNDSVTISGGKIGITGAKDGIKSDTPAEKPGKGYVNILGGEISITCADDGIQADSVILKNCRVSIEAGDKQINCDGDVSTEDGCLS